MILLVVVSLSIISLDLNGRTHSLTSGIKSVANSVFSPLRQGVVDVVSPIGNFLAGSLHYGALEATNQKLEATIGRLREAQAEKGYESTQLREVMALQGLPYLSGIQTVTAQTVNQYNSNFTITITIDKGRADGVDVGMPVVGAGGLVGQIIQAFHHSSVVRLITDGQSKVGVTFGNQLTGIIDGEGTDQSMSADLVLPHTALTKGEKMYTSSLNAAAFPAGIPVATVQSFHTSAGASQETITVAPDANLSQLAYVDVVQWEPAP